MLILRTMFITLVVVALAACGSRGGTDPSDPRYGAGQEESAEELYQAAKRQLDRGDYRGAAEQLENLQARYPFGAYFKQAQLDLIHAYFQAEEMSSAVAAADRYIRLNPQDEHVAYALYMRGRAHLEQGNDFLTRTFGIDRRIRDPEPMREAAADFNRLVERFPDSDYATDARNRMVALRNNLAHHEIHVARFYMRRGAYVAAANRAKGVVENFQGTPAVPEALDVMAEAYDRLGMEDLRTDVLRVIAANDPDHPVVQQHSELLPELGMQ